MNKGVKGLIICLSLVVAIFVSSIAMYFTVPKFKNWVNDKLNIEQEQVETPSEDDSSEDVLAELRAELAESKAVCLSASAVSFSASFALMAFAMSPKMEAPPFSLFVLISHLSSTVPSAVNNPHFTVVPPTSIPNT